MSDFKDHFSGHADIYREARPTYPPQLFAWLAQQAPDRAARVGLRLRQWPGHRCARRAFRARDRHRSERQQIAAAEARPNIDYRVEPAEHSSLAGASASLVTVAQALHWFDHAAFYAEVQTRAQAGRRLRRVGVFGLRRPAMPAIDRLKDELYIDLTGPYWPPERAYVDAGYKTLPFPFVEIAAPVLSDGRIWTRRAPARLFSLLVGDAALHQGQRRRSGRTDRSRTCARRGATPTAAATCAGSSICAAASRLSEATGASIPTASATLRNYDAWPAHDRSRLPAFGIHHAHRHCRTEHDWITPVELIALGAIWGGSFLFMRVAAPDFGPLALVEVRIVLGALSLLPFLWRVRRMITGVLWLRLGLFVVFFLVLGPLSSIQFDSIPSFNPIYATATLVADLITAMLLFAQFSILRSRSLLVIASGYLFTALIVIPWILTLPGGVASKAPLGGLQTTGWLYTFWHNGFILFVIAYALSKERDPGERFLAGVRASAYHPKCRGDRCSRPGSGISLHIG